MTISRAVRGTVTGLAAALIAVFPATLTPAAADIPISVLQSPKSGSLEISAPNARDLGGYPTQGGGGKIKPGSVYRADALNKLTAADQQALVTAGITKVIDFRSPVERDQNPDQLPGSIPAVHLPIYDPANDFYVFFGKLVQGGPEMQQEVLGNGGGAKYMSDYYAWMISDATARSQFAAAFTEIADSPGPVLYHCTAGKDRTGLMSAILMSALGVPRGQIYNDFLASNANLAASNQATKDYLVSTGKVTDPSLFDSVLGVSREFLDSAFNQIDASYGSFDNFLSSGLGIDAATVDAVKAKLLD
ncbi:tyrosine-protein phosphatase [Nocardia uniformis]|uniref:tyrosine-protein phosphatase n=1 Tax=Nocardia uniformis TaxID=53432 RepID=UPI000A7BA1C7|nr:tyrosine-protein phosphatase [Nocardia uniformis]